MVGFIAYNFEAFMLLLSFIDINIYIYILFQPMESYYIEDSFPAIPV